MAAWIKSYQSLREHPKTRKFARRVGGVPNAIGHLHCLWWWCLDYAPDGDLTKHDAEDIAIACEWTGEPQDIIKHLKECGFLDDDMSVHDWLDYGGTLLMQREEDRDRARRNYEKKRSLREVSAKSSGPEREKERKERKNARGRVADAEAPPARVEEMTPLQQIVSQKMQDCGLVKDGAA